jgi:uncharacterized membrane protein
MLSWKHTRLSYNKKHFPKQTSYNFKLNLLLQQIFHNEKYPHYVTGPVMGPGYRNHQENSARQVWSNGGMMINRGKLNKTLLQSLISSKDTWGLNPRL